MRTLHAISRPHSRHRIGRRVDLSVQQQCAADAAHGARGDDPLVHHRDRLSTTGPQRVDDRLHVLLVDDVVVGVVSVRNPARQGSARPPARRRAPDPRPQRSELPAQDRSAPVPQLAAAASSCPCSSVTAEVSASTRSCSARIRSTSSVRRSARRSVPDSQPCRRRQQQPRIRKSTTGTRTRHTIVDRIGITLRGRPTPPGHPGRDPRSGGRAEVAVPQEG